MLLDDGLVFDKLLGAEIRDDPLLDGLDPKPENFELWFTWDLPHELVEKLEL